MGALSFAGAGITAVGSAASGSPLDSSGGADASETMGTLSDGVVEEVLSASSCEDAGGAAGASWGHAPLGASAASSFSVCEPKTDPSTSALN